MSAILKSLNAHNFPIFQPILRMVCRALYYTTNETLILITKFLVLAYLLLYSKRIYSVNGISRSLFSLHKCLFKTYKNAFKRNASIWD